ncbi:MAG: regulatory protein RecX [Methyloglobulus sp.]|nr:regulatory protein RecX [Methyloglobulus sp.]
MKSNETQHNSDVNAVIEPHQISKNIKKDCLRLLTRRDHSRKEIQLKMAVKDYESSQVSAVIDDLAQQGWQDDTRYAESYARMRSHKGFGPIRIAYELQQQGIEAHTVDKVLQATSDNWLNLMEQVYNKKYPGPLAMDSNERAKRIRFLLHRGFSSAIITTLFK